MVAIAARFRYISKQGRLPIEDDRGVAHEGKEGVHDLVEQWRHAGARIAERSPHREAPLCNGAAHPPGEPARPPSRAREGKDGRRLTPRKADLRRWRGTFAEKLRDRGIEAEASPQNTRGSSRRTERLWHREARDEGQCPPREGEQLPVKLTRARRDAAQAWCEIAKALASSADAEDRKLGQSIVQYARYLPGVRYRPPEQQAQRELPSMERDRARTRDVERAAPTPDLQRNVEIDRGR